MTIFIRHTSDMQFSRTAAKINLYRYDEYSAVMRLVDMVYILLYAR